MLHHLLDVVLRCHRRSKSTGTHSQHASLFAVHHSRRVARRCYATYACCCGKDPASLRNLFSRLHWPRGRCKMTTHHKACILPAVHSSRSRPASLMFRLKFCLYNLYYTLLKVVSYYDLSVLFMSVMGFQKNRLDRGVGG